MGRRRRRCRSSRGQPGTGGEGGREARGSSGDGEKAGVHGEHQAGAGNRAGEVGRSFLAGVGSGGCVLRAQDGGMRMVGCGGGQTETGPETCANGLSLPRRLSPLGCGLHGGLPGGHAGDSDMHFRANLPSSLLGRFLLQFPTLESALTAHCPTCSFWPPPPSDAPPTPWASPSPGPRHSGQVGLPFGN